MKSALLTHNIDSATFSMAKHVVGETRNPKPEIRRKSEFRNPKSAIAAPGTRRLFEIGTPTQPNGFNLWRTATAFLPSDFCLRFSDFLRISDLGFRIS